MPSPQASRILSGVLYGGLSLVFLAVCIWAGWYLINDKNIEQYGLSAARGYYVLLAILGLSSALVLFGVLRSTATLTSQQFGVAVELGGPAVIAVLVVFGGFYATKQPEEFTIYVRLRAVPPVSDMADTRIVIDFDKRRDSRDFSKTGEVAFESVASRFKGAALPVEFQSSEYALAKPQAAYSVPGNGVLYLDVVKLPGAKPKQESAELCEGRSAVQLRTLGWAAFQEHNYDAAERAADSLEKCNKRDYMAYNLRGAVAFYRQQYDRASDQFTNALSLAPKLPDLSNNLADALTELAFQSDPAQKGERLRKAIGLYESVRYPGDFSTYKIARAKFFAGELGLALNDIRSVSSDYDYDGGRGKARILQGAIYLSFGKADPRKKAEYLKHARAQFEEGVREDRDFWKAIFLDGKKNLAEPFDAVRGIYGSYAKKWLVSVS